MTDDTSSPAPRPKVLNWTTMAFLIVTAVASLRTLPTMAEYGLGSITFFLVPAIVFMVPAALVSAELATGWNGGVYVWVREGFGQRWGAQAIWLQWIQNVVLQPALLSFVAGALAYALLNPSLANNGLYTALVIVGVYWGSILIALKGSDLSAVVGSRGMIIGTLVPGAVLVVLGFVWLARGDHSQVPLQVGDVIPQWTGFASIVLVVSNFLAYAGMEMNAVHTDDMKNPGRDYPKAIYLSVVLILLVFIVPTIMISVAVPTSQLGLTTGIVQAFDVYFHQLGISWLTPIFAGMIVIGAIASVIVWIAGPSRGLLDAARHGMLPLALQRRNKAGVQVAILLVQGAIVTVLGLVFVVVPNVSTAFFILTDMTALLYLIMYVLLFSSAIRLRRTQPDVPRGYRVPRMNLMAGTGLVAAVLAIALGFMPPSQLGGVSPAAWPFVMLIGVVLLGGGALVFHAIRKPEWRTIGTEPGEESAPRKEAA